jgi:hypothetical protein
MSKTIALILVLIGIVNVASDVVRSADPQTEISQHDNCDVSAGHTEGETKSDCGCGDDGTCFQCGLGHCTFLLAAAQVNPVHHPSAVFRFDSDTFPKDPAPRAPIKPPIA